MTPRLVAKCSPFIIDEKFLSVCGYVKPFRSYALPIGGVLENSSFFTPSFLGSGRKNFENRISAVTHTELVCTFCGDSSRDGTDLLSRRPGPVITLHYNI